MLGYLSQEVFMAASPSDKMSKASRQVLKDKFKVSLLLPRPSQFRGSHMQYEGIACAIHGTTTM